METTKNELDCGGITMKMEHLELSKFAPTVLTRTMMKMENSSKKA
jgi:hypothetical protein